MNEELNELFGIKETFTPNGAAIDGSASIGLVGFMNAKDEPTVLPSNITDKPEPIFVALNAPSKTLVDISFYESFLEFDKEAAKDYISLRIEKLNKSMFPIKEEIRLLEKLIATHDKEMMSYYKKREEQDTGTKRNGYLTNCVKEYLQSRSPDEVSFKTVVDHVKSKFGKRYSEGSISVCCSNLCTQGFLERPYRGYYKWKM